MRQSNTNSHLRKQRRQSKLSTPSIFSFFTSAPPSPVREPYIPKPRSQSLGEPLEVPHSTTASSARNKSSTIASIISKAKRHNVKRSHTAVDLSPHRECINDHGMVSPPASQLQPESTTDYFSSATIHPFARIDQPICLFENDEEEIERLQLKNDLVKLAFDSEFVLPINFKSMKEGRILDVGCGPGSWCVEIAQQYPQIEVVGVDCDMVFPEPNSIPANCKLFLFNVLRGLQRFHDASFDFIHIRFMVLAFTFEQYRQVIKDCWRILKPGGYLGIMEGDMMIYSTGPVTAELNYELIDMANSQGFKPLLARQLAEIVPEDAHNYQEKYHSLPIGVWGGRLGVMFRDDMVHVLRKSQPAIARHYDRPEKSRHAFEAAVNKMSYEVEQYHSYSNFHFISLQKPNNESFEPQ
ncbi:S-adenosyl-L-methionine-dependent methyltransferase [Radiomyces spectabilis]|uniref:S-adenosyl-L-methionine-dependent methyltransferase n=1 Tax=Radiomyces spectabilis TaxID=64574 RepID=UPI00222002A7|nr:S-adenosyl-L-methionine-dependent methyltransferase [Radiomyces spectabilis]KAI8367526.1 S-adenosyl-L-methionine-dependent methyltransferase [Radiomyces spectabilis]